MTPLFMPGSFDYKPKGPFILVTVDGRHSACEFFKGALNDAMIRLYCLIEDSTVAGFIFDKTAHLVYSVHNGKLWGVEASFRASEELLEKSEYVPEDAFLHLGFELAARLHWPAERTS